MQKGDWNARMRPDLNVTFEELTTKGQDGLDMIEKPNEVRFVIYSVEVAL